ncbi:alpha/beta hydrolase [Herminiimonas sp. NPDC097707]|uniref:alpha/beta hydrolase n=1 Tax=Herminiimonas sp. NPDC097707 TaxID=3364007 RepID=UPI00383B61EB
MTEHEFLFEGGRTGVLLIHGLTGTPNEMRLLGKGLHRAGHTVYGMQLAGHCGTTDDLIATNWQDWYDSVRVAADHLRTRVDRMFVMGLSMGALLSLKLAADQPEKVAGVGALATMFQHDGWSIPFYTRLSFLLRIFKVLHIGRNGFFTEQPPYGIKDAVLRKRIVAQMHSGDSSAAGLPGNPWWSIAELYGLAAEVRRQLPTITTPCLLVHATEDDVASLEKNALLVKNSVKGPVQTLWLQDSYHMVTIDRERRLVIEQACNFIAQTLNIDSPTTVKHIGSTSSGLVLA